MRGRVVIEGERVLLRPFREEEFETWLAVRQASADRTVSPAGPPDPERLRRRVQRSGELRGGSLDLAIEVDGRLAGEIGTYVEPGRTVEPGTFFLAIALFDPTDRGRGLGTESVRMLCDWLFSQAGAEQVKSATAATNAPMRRVFERLGFAYEGVETRWDIEWARYDVSREAWLSA